MAKRDRCYIHAVNADGIRRIIPNPNYASHDSDKDMNEGYFFDVDWYLSHGCMTFEELFSDIESINRINATDISK